MAEERRLDMLVLFEQFAKDVGDAGRGGFEVVLFLVFEKAVEMVGHFGFVGVPAEVVFLGVGSASRFINSDIF